METPKKNKPSHDAHLPLCTSQPALNDKKRAPKHHPTLHPQKQKGQPLRGQPLVVPRPPLAANSVSVSSLAVLAIASSQNTRA